MIYKKGETSKKLQKGVTILSVQVFPVIGKKTLSYVGQMINLSIYAGFKRDNVEMPFGRWFFYLDPDGYLHIHPTPDKSLLVRVRFSVIKEL